MGMEIYTVLYFLFQYRSLLLELLQNSKVVTYKELVSKAQEVGEKPSRETLLKTLKVIPPFNVVTSQ